MYPSTWSGNLQSKSPRVWRILKARGLFIATSPAETSCWPRLTKLRSATLGWWEHCLKRTTVTSWPSGRRFRSLGAHRRAWSQGSFLMPVTPGKVFQWIFAYFWNCTILIGYLKSCYNFLPIFGPRDFYGDCPTTLGRFIWILGCNFMQHGYNYRYCNKL